MIDFSASVPSSLLADLGVPRGGRKVIDLAERSSVMDSLGESDFSLAAGGSLSNTLAGLGKMSQAARIASSFEAGPASPPRPLRLGLTGLVGHCHLSDFFSRKLGESGVSVLTDAAQPAASTGTVMVLTDEDAQRSFLSYPGDLQPFTVNATLAANIAAARLLVLEGYLFEVPGVEEAIAQAIAVAKVAGTTVVLTAGDAGIVRRFGDAMRCALSLGVDVLFANADEARELAQLGPAASAKEAAEHLAGRCKVVAVTDGAAGAHVSAWGETSHVDPVRCLELVDTCGAGDAFATGFLFAMLSGTRDVKAMGAAGARVAAAVCARSGNALSLADSEKVLETLVAEGIVAPPSTRGRRRSFEGALSS